MTPDELPTPAGGKPAGSRKRGRPALLALGLLLSGFALYFLAGPTAHLWRATRQEASTPLPAPPPTAAGSGEAAGRPGERILSFHSDVAVQPDGTLLVREAIRVRAEHRKIRRGIYRDFPTRYHWEGRRYDVGFAVEEVERDGLPEPWHQQPLGNGTRVYMGESGRFVPEGVHTYVLSYRTDRQLGRFEEHDELYWNVTGNGWEFPIDEASCAVALPAGVPPGALEGTGFTGPQGSTERSVAHTLGADGVTYFRSTRPLGAREGLTIALRWPKGHVAGASWENRAWFFAADNRNLMPGFLGLAILLVFYGVSWVLVGRDPERGVVVPLFDPPRKLSAAAVRYVREMGFDNKVFTAAVLDLASRGYLTLRDDDGTLHLAVRPDADVKSLPPRLQRVARKLFPSGTGSLELKNENHARIGGALKALRESLAREHLAVAFHDNRAYFGWGMLITVLAIAAMLAKGGLPPDGVFILVWLSMWTAAAVFLWVQRVWFFAVVWTVTDVLVLALTFGKAMPAGSMAIFLGVIAALVVANAVFYQLLKAPTRLGRALMDEIEGFRTYLAAAEGDRLNRMHPPQRTPQLFERYLPYALALGVEQEWAEQFSGVLDRAGAEPSSQGYRPTWYHGSRYSSRSLSSLTSDIGSSLTSAISSSSRPPGSSSGGGGGFGGGGSSGGGGGGGGGGGW